MRVAPSDVTSLILRLFPTVDPGKSMRPFSMGHALHFSAILAALDRIPEELIVLPPHHFLAFQTSVEVMRLLLDHWKTRGDCPLRDTPGFAEKDPITHIYLLLSRCPDEPPSSETPGFEFIADEQLRDALKVDRAGRLPRDIS